jgi:hypothetical protein
MGATKITMTGADEAHYRDATASQTRVIAFPDGVTRHITLTTRQWQVFDALPEHGWPRSSLLIWIVRNVRELENDFGPFFSYEHYDTNIRWCLENFLELTMHMCSAHPRDAVNDR